MRVDKPESPGGGAAAAPAPEARTEGGGPTGIGDPSPAAEHGGGVPIPGSPGAGSPSAGSPVPGSDAAPSGGAQRRSESGRWELPEEDRSRRLLRNALAALGIAVAFAVLLGLLIVGFAKSIGGSSSDNATPPPALVIPTAPGGAAGAAIPADWVDQTSSSGVVFKAPPGWTQRSDGTIDFRVEPSAGGPGIGQVGVGLSTATTDPDAAVSTYVNSTYSGQSGFTQQPATDQVSARGERGRESAISYSRSGTRSPSWSGASPRPAVSCCS